MADNAAKRAGPLKIMLVAVEPSADAIGAALFEELKAAAPAGTAFLGCGGPAMVAAGFESLFAIDALSVMGFTDVARALPEGIRRANQLTRAAVSAKIDAVVFIDGWAFSRVCAKRMRRQCPDVKLIKFAAPQIWASRPQRVDFVRDHFDGVLTLFPFEAPLFEAAGVRAEFIGNPNFQKAWNERGDGAAFRADRNIGDGPLLAVLLGSRKSELRHLGGVFGETVEILLKEIKDLRIVIPVADHIADDVRAFIKDWPGDPMLVAPNEKPDALAAATAALAVSGTISTEIAINNTPMIIAYRVDALTAFWAKRVVITPYGAIINVAADKEIIPEFIQERARPALLADAIRVLLTSHEARAAQLEAFPAILKQLGIEAPSASKTGARKILQWIA